MSLIDRIGDKIGSSGYARIKDLMQEAGEQLTGNSNFEFTRQMYNARRDGMDGMHKFLKTTKFDPKSCVNLLRTDGLYKDYRQECNTELVLENSLMALSNRKARVKEYEVLVNTDGSSLQYFGIDVVRKVRRLTWY